MKPIDTKTWQEFKISDLFDSQTGDTDLKKPHLNDKGHAVITSGLNNMGVFGYSDEPAKIIKKNTITVDMFGYAIFRPFDYKMVTHARVFSLEPKGFELNEMTGLYMSTIFKHLSTLFNYNNMCSYNKIKHLTVKLPVQPTLDPDKTYHPNGYIPDWDYMEAFMEQINQQAQARLDEYKEGKLEYTTLDSKIGYTPVDTKTWKEFKISDLFEIENGKYVDPKTLTIDDNGSPYLRASIFNNGQDVDKYTGEGFKTKPNIISWGKQSPFFSYHTKACYTGQGIYWFKFDKGQNVAHFICTVLQRVGKNYNYQNCLTGAKLKHETIQLPVDQTGQPDWDYMEAFMKKINQQAQAKLQQIEKGNI